MSITSNDVQSSSADAASQPDPTPVEACPLTTSHWIEINLVDEDGNPIANEAYTIVTATGVNYNGSLDSAGCVRINNIDPGDCQVSFPDIDQHEPVRR